MADLATQLITIGGITPALDAASAGGDQFSPGDRTFLYVNNTGGAAADVTVDATASGPGGLALTDKVVAVAAGEDAFLGPFPYGVYADVNGFVNVSYSEVAGVNVGVFAI